MMIKIKEFHNSVLNSCTYCLYDNQQGEAAIIDPGDIDPIHSWLFQNDRIVNSIFLTHAHFDHVYGLFELYRLFPNCKIYCSKETYLGLKDSKINKSYMFLDGDLEIPDNENFVFVNSKNVLEVMGVKVGIIETPGHDDDCLTYIIDKAIFTGDSYSDTYQPQHRWNRSNLQVAAKSEIKIKRIIEDNGLIVYPGHFIN